MKLLHHPMIVGRRMHKIGSSGISCSFFYLSDKLLYLILSSISYYTYCQQPTERQITKLPTK
jgi:hypothetical protein